MKKEYDLSKMKMRKNPYASKLKRQVTIRMGDDVVTYFKELAEETGIPYQSLINLYLKDCVARDANQISAGVEIMRPNKPMQIDSARAVRLHEWSCRPFYHANGHRMHCD